MPRPRLLRANWASPKSPKDGRERALTVTPGAIQKADLSNNAAKAQFSKEAAVAAYYALNESGFDRNLPTANANQGIEVFHEFLDLRGNTISKVKLGEEFFVRVRLRSTKRDYIPQVAVVDLLPGGTEAVQPLGSSEKSTWTPQHIDVRDDRIVLYGSIGKDVSTYVYRARATNAGVYQAPPAFAENMYDPKTSGLSTAAKLEIEKP